MVNVVRTIRPENNMDISDIGSFETENYIGIYHYATEKFALILKAYTMFKVFFLEEKNFNDLEELNHAVYDLTSENIERVSDSTAYEFKIVELPM